jgi:sugar/nucleoside kinase (ribokinase family)
MADIVCLGIMVADVVARPVKEIPERGRLVLVDRIELHTGGCAVNTAIALARLGIKTAVIGKVGEDGFGRFIVERLMEEGVDTRGVRSDRSANTSATMVLVAPDGERAFIHYTGTNASFLYEDIDWDIISEAKILHVAGSLVMPGFDGEPTARAMKRAKDMGLITALDTVWDSTGRWLQLVGPSLQYTDIFLPSIEEAKMMTGREREEDIASFLLDRGVKIVGLKMGERGCYIRTREEEYRIPAFKVPVVDATGAGDAFVAGFLAGTLMGWDLRERGRLANAVGAACVMGMGAASGLRDLEGTMKIMEEYEEIR